jgi:hypothetical protein
MSFLRLFKYKFLLSQRSRKYASLAMSIALAHASFGAVKYKSLGNGIADISLSLDEDQNFSLDLKAVDAPKTYKLKGTWEKEHDNYVLKFKRRQKDLGKFFESNTGYSNNNLVADKKTVKIPSLSTGVVIWGIFCEKEFSQS